MAFDAYSIPEPTSAALDDAARTVIESLLAHMKPKARAKARADLDEYVALLETWNGWRIPGPNVIPIRGPSWSERQREAEAVRLKRASAAAAVRRVVERAFD